MSLLTTPGHRDAPTSASATGRSVDPEAQRQAQHHAERRAQRQAVLGRIRFRRALTLVLMTLVLPGSAQLVVGRRRIGQIAIRVWLGLWAGLLLVAGIGFLWHGLLFWLFSSTTVLALLRLVFIALAVGWAALFVDAWRLGRPLELERRHRLVIGGLNAALSLVVAGSLLFGAHLVDVQRGFISAMFGDGAASAATDGRYNVLLVGGDSGDDRWGLRTDSLTVASIDEDTGRTILFGLPRNMTNFPFPEGSEMAERFPDGYDCEECTLNSLATWAADNRDAFADESDPGMAATIQGVEGITGLKINYFAMVNMQGFRSLVSAMGGLTLNVRDRIPIGLPVTDYIEPGVRKLNGFETLWFTRSRSSADDYSRMARQKCVMSAMVQQLSPQLVLRKFEGLAKASESLLETDLPASELNTFVELALKARSQKMATLSFVPPQIVTANPDIDKIHAMVDKAIARSEGTEGAKERAGKGFSRRAQGPQTGGSLGSMSSGYAANQANDLSKVC
jgi:LCP family protein required for cell wall assembly